MKPLPILTFVLGLLTSILASSDVFAHAAMEVSAPAAGATVQTSPKEIVLTFNEEVEQTFSAVKLKNDAGKNIELGKLRQDPTNAAILRTAVPRLDAGSYQVLWVAVGHDGHRRNGEFKFRVK